MNNYTYTYFADRDRKWPMKTNSRGRELLEELDKYVENGCKYIEEKLIAEGKTPEEVKKILDRGREIYADKPNQKNASGTWSETEYGNLGFQYHYLKYKSVQRFTECYSMFERAAARGVKFDAPWTAVSIGGGPGYELIAAAKFGATQLYSIDLEPTWEPYCSGLGCKFIRGSFFEVDKIREIVANVSRNDSCGRVYVIFSYVVQHYIKNPRIFNELLRVCDGIFINERARKMQVFNSINNISMLTNDHRQVFIGKHMLNAAATSGIPTFPNVPYDY